MPYVPYTNNGSTDAHIGGRTIKPGETRDVDARFIPASPYINREIMVAYINFNGSPRYFGTTRVDAGGFARLSIIHFQNPNVESSGDIQTEIFKQLLDRKIEDIKPYISLLEEDEILVLKAIEESEGKRKTLVDEFEKVLAERKEEREFTVEKYLNSLKELDDDQLQVELLKVSDHEVKTKLVEGVIAERKAAEQQPPKDTNE